MPLSNEEDWIHPIKAIMVKKKGKAGVPRLEGMIDSGHEDTTNEEERHNGEKARAMEEEERQEEGREKE